MATERLDREVVELTRDLIRLDTSNPPGRETPAAEMLAEYLRGAGVECELVGPDPDRLNVVGRVIGTGSSPSIMLMGHIDVVPAPVADWTVPPFDAVVRDGQLVGRGAVDMKGEVAARAAAVAELARRGEPPAGDVVFVAESDEEANVSDVGMSWLVRERPDVRCDFAINEGGGSLLELADGRRVVTVSVGEKQVSSLRLRVHGSAAHASVPAFGDNPVRHAAAASELLLGYEPLASTVPAIARALERLGAPPAPDEAVEWAAAQHPLLADMLPAMTRMTVTPTGLHTFEPANVIPPYADVTCDCRALPGQTEADVHRHVAVALGDRFEYELELLEPLQGGTESRIDTPLYGVIERYVADRLPGAELLPLVTPGFTDSHWVRKAGGTVAYGFAPVFSTDPSAYARAAHAADESLDLADLVEMARFHLHAISAAPG